LKNFNIAASTEQRQNQNIFNQWHF